MVISLNDAAKLVGIAIIVFCAVLVCTMFVNFYLDVRSVEDMIGDPAAEMFYRAQLSTAKVVCGVSGGCLFVTAVVMLCFYIKYYIDAHKKELGILKALGYADLAVAGHFYIFGFGVLVGGAAGFAGAFALMPRFYALQNEKNILPAYQIHFHPGVLVCFVLLPTVFFSLLAVLYAYRKMRCAPLALLRGVGVAARYCKPEKTAGEGPFIRDMQKSNLRTGKALVFFMFFASFCFSAMTQMSFSMKDLASEMMGAMILGIGLLLSFVTLFLAVTTVVRGNGQAIAMMRALGYSERECRRALLDGYRPASFVGFALGTLYQYGLLRIMVDIVFRDIGDVPAYEFDFPMMALSLAVFVVLYEGMLYFYGRRMRHISVKEIMTE